MFHLSAWYQSVDPANVLLPLDAVREEMLFTSGDDIRTPSSLANIIGAAALANDATAVRAQIQSPSLRILANLDVEPLVIGSVFGNPPETLFHSESPIPLIPDEALNFAIQSDPAAAAVHYGLVWLADGPQQAVRGNFFSVRATSAVTLAAGTWVNGNLTFAQTLPAGTYQIVGMRARGTNLVAARLVFPEQVARPGAPAVNAIGDNDAMAFRYGRIGIFGEFPHTNPPTVDCLGVTDTSQVYILDLVRTR